MMTMVEAVVALGLGAGGGAGFLFSSGDMKGAPELAKLQSTLTEVQGRITQTQGAIEAAKRADEDRRMKEAAQQVEAERAAKEAAARQAAAANQPQQPVATGPKFGILSIKSPSVDLDVDGGPGLKGKGKSVDLSYDEAPGKVKVKAGKYTVTLTPKVAGKVLVVDVAVQPMAIIQTDGGSQVGSVSGLEVTKGAYKIDLKNPAFGDVNLVLQYKK